MNDGIKPIRKNIQEKDFDIPGLSIDDFNKYQLCTINNYLTTNIRINLLCQEIGIQINDKSKRLIDLMNFIRNGLYHRGMPFLELSKEITKKRKRFGFKSFEFQDLISQVSRFELLVQNIFLKFLNLLPDHLINFDNIQRLIWKSDIQENNFNNTTIYSKLEEYKDILRLLIRKEKYIPVLKVLERDIEPSVNKILQIDIKGNLYKDKKCYPIKIKFDDEFSGNFECSSLHINELIKNNFLFKTEIDGVKLCFDLYIDLIEPKGFIGGVMKLYDFLKIYCKNQGSYSTLYLEFGF